MITTSNPRFQQLICRTILCLLPAVLLYSVPAIATAQWSIVSPGGGSTITNGAMCFSDGVVWAGGQTVRYSYDSGKVWQTAYSWQHSRVLDIAFFDKRTGAIASQDGLFMTSDGGASWHLARDGSYVKVAFNGSASTMHALTGGGSLFTSFDGGSSWSQSFHQSTSSFSFAVGKDRTVYVLTGDWGSQIGCVHSSADYGRTWSAGGSNIDFDSWTLSADSCDAKRLYLANEEYYSSSPADGRSQIYVSTDGGMFWRSADSYAGHYYSGAFAVTSNALFAGTVGQANGAGIRRSVDNGVTWKGIGGPAVPADSRNIVAINANMLLAMDETGNIWATNNCGGQPVPHGSSDVLAVSPKSLFSTDTTNCGTMLSRTIAIRYPACGAASIIGLELQGKDAKSYSTYLPSNDTIVVGFTPAHAARHQAALVISFDDGRKDTIALAGYNHAPVFSCAIAEHDLFAGDSAYYCTPPVTRSIRANFRGCPASITSQQIIGAHASEYTIVHSIANTWAAADSACVTFRASSPGRCDAEYELTFEDGTRFHIPLEGYGIAPKELVAKTKDVAIDTIGGNTVVIPIFVEGLDRAEDIELTIDFDTALHYLGTYDCYAAQLPEHSDRNQQATVRVQGAVSGGPIANARFTTTKDTAVRPRVSFTCSGIPTAHNACEYGLPGSVVSTVFPQQSCGNWLISQLMNQRCGPTFRVAPNPAQAEVALTSSDALGDVTIEFLDMMGAPRLSRTAHVDANAAVHVATPEGSGIYTVRVRSGTSVSNCRVVVRR